MTKRRELTKIKNGYRTVWRWAEDKSFGVEVDVYEAQKFDSKPIIEWGYGRVPGFNSLAALSMLFLDQAILQAKSEQEKTSVSE